MAIDAQVTNLRRLLGTARSHHYPCAVLHLQPLPCRCSGLEINLLTAFQPMQMPIQPDRSLGKGRFSQFPENWAGVQPFSTGPWCCLQCLGSSFPESCVRVNVEWLGHHSYSCYFAGGIRYMWAKEGIVLSSCLLFQWQGRQVFSLAALSHCPV